MNSVTMVNGVDDEQITDAEGAPETSESAEDEPRVPDPGDRAQPHHHLLIDVEHRNEKRQGPQQRHAVVLTGLRVGGHATGVVVTDHHDETGSQDRQQHPEPLPTAAALDILVLSDGAQSADDVPDMRAVHDSACRAMSVGVVPA